MGWMAAKQQYDASFPHTYAKNKLLSVCSASFVYLDEEASAFSFNLMRWAFIGNVLGPPGSLSAPP
jgi:hypothetical protein